MEKERLGEFVDMIRFARTETDLDKLYSRNLAYAAPTLKSGNKLIGLMDNIKNTGVWKQVSEYDDMIICNFTPFDRV